MVLSSKLLAPVVWSARLAGLIESTAHFSRRDRMKLSQALTATLGLGAFGMILVNVAEAEGAGDCAITYTRTACPGQEAESYKKCDGKQSCTKLVAADSEAKCQEAAVAACSNDRLTVTKSKVIGAKFKGKALKTKAGQDDMCLDYAKRAAEFNQCDKN
jgi:hypothetical protein